MENPRNAPSGFVMLLTAFGLLAAGIAILVTQVKGGSEASGTPILVFIFCIFAAGFICKGLRSVEPNFALVLTFFGKYVGSIRKNGLIFVNPLFKVQKINLRVQSLETNKLKVNDKMGNPIEIAAVILWKIADTYRVTFDVVSFTNYVINQSEAALRHIASTCPYDILEDENSEITLRDGGDKVIAILQDELNERLSQAGIQIVEARLSHLAYSPEIAGAMLQRQQAIAIVAARSKIVEGAVGMVEMALETLSKKQIITLDEEKKASMVSNLMVVLCGEKAATPVLNTGTLYQ
ncbi:MAG TPA: SPFH domain-containing protein [Sediminibacterium sp.]|nr:SPFH domain-containing protein [Sediminibacterium sp.]